MALPPPQTANPFKINIGSFFIRFAFNLLFAAVIFSQAELGRLLGIRDQPLAISYIWPATGFSLAAFLLFGHKIWPGVFLGNFCYNFLHLVLYSGNYAISLPIAIVVSFGSLLQAFVGNSILRRYCSKGYFNTVKDIAIFLVPGGLFTCLIASTIGVVTLYLYKPTPFNETFTTWLTFWIGDLLGVYIFTPLLVVWAILQPISRIKDYAWEALIIGISLLGIIYLTSTASHLFYHFYIPIALWCAFRFGLHGGTFIIFSIALAMIIPTALGINVFNVASIAYPLSFLVLFLEVLVATVLIFSGMVNEKEVALLQSSFLFENAQRTVQSHQNALEERDYQLFSQSTLLRLKELMLGAIRWVRIPLSAMHNPIQESFNCSKELHKIFQTIKEKLPVETASHIKYQLENLDILHAQLVNNEMKAEKLIQAVEEQAKRVVPDKLRVQAVNMKILLSQCLNEAMSESEKKYPDFTFSVFEEFEEAVSIALAAPDELMRAFELLLVHAIDSMKAKKDRLGSSYAPILKMRAKTVENYVEIMIRDNGLGVSSEELNHLFVSFYSPPTDELAEKLFEGIDLYLAHDLIVHVYKGNLHIGSKVDEYLQLDIKLPVKI